jgi:hypothetical protein
MAKKRTQVKFYGKVAQRLTAKGDVLAASVAFYARKLDNKKITAVVAQRTARKLEEEMKKVESEQAEQAVHNTSPA